MYTEEEATSPFGPGGQRRAYSSSAPQQESFWNRLTSFFRDKTETEILEEVRNHESMTVQHLLTFLRKNGYRETKKNQYQEFAAILIMTDDGRRILAAVDKDIKKEEKHNRE